MASEDDPVKRALSGEVDLYDVASWDARTRLDAFAVWLTGGLRTARTWLLVLLAAVLFLAQVAIAGVLVLDRPVLGVFALGSVVPALALAGYLWYDDPTRREPLETLAVTFILSILFASFAALVNTVFQPLFGLVPVVGIVLFFFLVVAPIEETVKWLSIRVHAYKTESFDAVIDGVVYGAVAGLGFAAIENLIYIVNVYSVTGAEQTAQIGAAFRTAYQRAFVGPGHVIYSAFAGYYLGLAKFNPGNRGPIVVKGLLIAGFVHALYNTLVSVLPLGGLTFAAFILVYDGFWLGVLYRKISRYESYYDRIGRGDVAGGIPGGEPTGDSAPVSGSDGTGVEVGWDAGADWDPGTGDGTRSADGDPPGEERSRAPDPARESIPDAEGQDGASGGE